MGRIGPTYLLPYAQHQENETMTRHIGGALHKTVQLAGSFDHAVVEISVTIDPNEIEPGKRDTSWSSLGYLTGQEAYKHHVGFVRWIRVRVQQGGDGPFGVVLMAED